MQLLRTERSKLGAQIRLEETGNLIVETLRMVV